MAHCGQQQTARARPGAATVPISRVILSSRLRVQPPSCPCPLSPLLSTRRPLVSVAPIAAAAASASLPLPSCDGQPGQGPATMDVHAVLHRCRTLFCCAAFCVAWAYLSAGAPGSPFASMTLGLEAHSGKGGPGSATRAGRDGGADPGVCCGVRGQLMTWRLVDLTGRGADGGPAGQARHDRPWWGPILATGECGHNRAPVCSAANLPGGNAGLSGVAKTAWAGLAAGVLHTLCGPDHLAVRGRLAVLGGACGELQGTSLASDAVRAVPWCSARARTCCVPNPDLHTSSLDAD